jgi:hypothetical protein
MAAHLPQSSPVRWPHEAVEKCVNTIAKLDTLEPT